MSLRLLAFWNPERQTYGAYKKWLLDLLTIQPDRQANQ